MQKNRGMIAAGAALLALCAAAVALGLCAKFGWIVKKQPDWVSVAAFAAAAVALLAVLFSAILRGTDGANTGKRPLALRLLFSDLLLNRSRAARLSYIGVTAALLVVSNLFEIKFATTQFSLTLFTSCLAGILLGALPGACAVLAGDALGYTANSMGYPYYWWVALSCAAMAVVSGLVMRLPLRNKGGLYLKLALISILTFFVCSVGINTTGMYFFGLKLYFPKDVQEAVGELFGGKFDYWIYCLIRFGVLGQIWNSLVNYALLFLTVPALRSVRSLAEGD